MRPFSANPDSCLVHYQVNHFEIKTGEAKEMAKALMSLPELETIDFFNNGLSPGGARCIAEVCRRNLPNIRNLNLSGNGLEKEEKGRLLQLFEDAPDMVLRCGF